MEQDLEHKHPLVSGNFWTEADTRGSAVNLSLSASASVSLSVVVGPGGGPPNLDNLNSTQWSICRPPR